ncbi:MAG: threonine synthase [bacterium]|nr:threonine synthase [bacterium]
MKETIIRGECVRGHKIRITREHHYTCPDCGSNLDILYDYSLLKKKVSRSLFRKSGEFSIFRYLEFFPFRFRKEDYSRLQIGWTPLYHASRLASLLHLPSLYIKDDSRQPSGSLKDRAGIMALIHCLETGPKMIIAASTGNAASSLACLSAGLGTGNAVFVPKNIPRAKLAQLRVYGSRVIMVNGNYDSAYELSVRATEKFGWYNRNTGFNPFTREGKKTVSYEIIEQLNWSVPDYIFVPVGDGNIISGVWKGLKDFYYAGLIRKLPRLVAVQSSGSAAVARAFLEKRGIRPVKAGTLADSISVDFPRDGDFALKAIIESDGLAVIVPDKEILQAQKLLACCQGIFIEPSGSAPLAGLMRLLKEKKISGKKSVVLLATGSGLKDIDAVLRGSGPLDRIEPDIREVERIFRKKTRSSDLFA